MSDAVAILNKGRKEFITENGDNKVSIKLLPMSSGIKVTKELISLLAPAIGSMADGVRHDEYLHGAPKSFSDLAFSLVSQLDKVDIIQLIHTLLQGMLVNTKQVDLEEYFTANYDELVEILEFALKENFGSFFTGKGTKARFLTVIQNLMQGSTTQESETE